MYHVIETPITKNVSRLNSSPKLGLEHAAYRIKSDDRTFWIDCPSCFDTTLAPMDDILFTHFHFLGASNQYREYFSSKVCIHQADSRFEICRGFPFDHTFQHSFEENGIEAHHIDGHTPGFVCYFFEDVFLMCDYVFYGKKGMRFNPFGPVSETINGGFHIKELLDGRDISKVCAVDYVMDFNDWILGFDGLLASVKN